MKWYIFLVITSFWLLFLVKCSHGVSVPKNVAEAIQASIDYYNRTISLAESLELLEKYYELEREEGVFLPSKLRQAPKEMLKVSEDLEAVEFRLKRKLNSKDKVALASNLREIEKDLENNFGARKNNFRIRKNDPLSTNLLAVKRMNAHWDGVMDEFEDYKRIQFLVQKTYNVLPDFGIYLHPRNIEPEFVILLKKEEAEEFIKVTPKSKDYTRAYLFDILDKVMDRFPKGLARQTSQEIQALERAKNGEMMDPVSQSMLEGFLTELNKKSFLIIAKLKIFEETIDLIEEESQNYASYIMDKRIELYQQLDEVKSNFNLIEPHDEL